jgi:hypothetical protein
MENMDMDTVMDTGMVMEMAILMPQRRKDLNFGKNQMPDGTNQVNIITENT